MRVKNVNTLVHHPTHLMYGLDMQSMSLVDKPPYHRVMPKEPNMYPLPCLYTSSAS